MSSDTWSAQDDLNWNEVRYLTSDQKWNTPRGRAGGEKLQGQRRSVIVPRQKLQKPTDPRVAWAHQLVRLICPTVNGVRRKLFESSHRPFVGWSAAVRWLKEQSGGKVTDPRAVGLEYWDVEMLRHSAKREQQRRRKAWKMHSPEWRAAHPDYLSQSLRDETTCVLTPETAPLTNKALGTLKHGAQIVMELTGWGEAETVTHILTDTIPLGPELPGIQFQALRHAPGFSREWLWVDVRLYPWHSAGQQWRLLKKRIFQVRKRARAPTDIDDRVRKLLQVVGDPPRPGRGRRKAGEDSIAGPYWKKFAAEGTRRFKDSTSPAAWTKRWAYFTKDHPELLERRPRRTLRKRQPT